MSMKKNILSSLSDKLNNTHISDFFLHLQEIVNSQGGIAKLADSTNLNRESLYKTLSGKRDPRISTVLACLSSLGIKIKLEADKNYLYNKFNGISGFETPWIDLYLNTPDERLIKADQALKILEDFSSPQDDK